ncbi:MAG: class I SAM-dependent methyltransferase [Elusimicrobia bacterium]|nr:class I SAM-dependent methyltransferase [Elusimicrobiota bacterium]
MKESIDLEKPVTYTAPYNWWKKSRAIFQLVGKELIKKLGPVRILDLGCGKGNDIFALNSLYGKKYKIEFTGLDLSPKFIETANEYKSLHNLSNFNFLADNVEKAGLKGESFDIIICSELLEHLTQPEICIKRAYDLVKKGGAVIFTTPNKGNMFARVGRVFWQFLRKGKVNETDFVPQQFVPEFGLGHVSVKDYREWIGMFRKAGFKIEKVRRGAAVCGGTNFDSHPLLFGLLLVTDVIMDYLPFTAGWAEQNIFLLRKL